MKKKIITLTIVLLLLFITACNKNDDINEEEAQFKSPFTGLVTDEETLTNRAVAVMINNEKAARPQTGLSQADIVIEMLAEGNITRFLAIFQSEMPTVVGPVRSAREYYVSLAEGYEAIYVYHGAAKFIDEMIKERGIDYINGALYDNDKKLFVREPFRKAPHNSYLQMNALYETASDLNYETKHEYESFEFLEEVEELAEEEDAPYVKIQYYKNSPIVEYEYDADSETYVRYNDGEETIELETEKPVQIDNVFIVETDHEVIDEQQRRDIDIKSGGKAYLLQKGKVLHVDWENRNGKIIPVKNGEVVPFVQGKTWINFVETEPPSEVTEQVQFTK